MASPNTSSVKAWIYTTPSYPETLTFSTLDNLPPKPAPHHIFLRTQAAAINPVDIQLMNLPLFYLPGLRQQRIPGCDFSGTVLASSPEADFKAGDEICGFVMSMMSTGSLTEVMHLDTRQAVIIKKPTPWSHVQAASLPLVWLTAQTSIAKVAPFLEKASASAKKLVVLGGSSATGIYTVLIAKQRGWLVLATCSGRNVDFVRSMGADEVVDYTTSPSAVVRAVQSYAPAAIIDNVGGTDCIGLAPQYVTIVGDKTSRSSVGGSMLYWTRPRMLLRWAWGAIGLGNSYECITMDLKKEYLEKATALPVDKIIIDSKFSFDRVRDAFERLNTGRARGKVVVTISPS